MRLRSILFVPADRPERFEKAAGSGADCVILDLEDSVAPERKAFARDAVVEWLGASRICTAFVRVNPLDGAFIENDLEKVLPARPDGIVLPKAEGANSVVSLLAQSQGKDMPPILPIATETPGAIFHLGTYGAVCDKLVGLSWGAEDLPAAIGATASRDDTGQLTAPYEMVRALTLFGAHAAGVAAIETVYPDIGDKEGLARYVARGRRDGFTGMLAIHPAQVQIINEGFSPSASEIAQAQEIVEAFASQPGAGALRLNGKMIDRPHLVQARRILATRFASTTSRASGAS